MPEGGGARRAFLRRSFGEAAGVALDAAARSAPLTVRERAAAASLAPVDHLVVLRFAGRPRAQVFGELDGDPGDEFAGSTDEVMTSPARDGASASGRFAPAMLPVHTLLARSFARAAHWSADGRDPLRLLLAAARSASIPWLLVADERQGVSTTLLADHDRGGVVDAVGAGGAVLTLAGLKRILAGSGALPPLVLVEPRSLVDPADFASAVDLGESRSADARRAEQLLHEVYEVVRALEAEGRRSILLVAARGSSGEVPSLVVAPGARGGDRIEAPLDAGTPALLLRARFASDRRALADEGVLALAEAVAGPPRALSRWPRTAPAFTPTPPAASVPPRLTAALRLAGLPEIADETADHALARLRAAVPGASVHSDEARIRATRGGRSR